MFELIKQLLGKSSKWSPEPQKVVEPSQEPAREESVSNNLQSQNAAESKYQEQPSQGKTSPLQTQLNSLPNGAKLSLWPPKGEYAGPVVIDHPLILDGQGATIWALTGPVLSIQSDGVSLENLRIEVTRSDEGTGGQDNSNQQDYCAILVKSGQSLKFHDVEVRGTAMGLPDEAGEWKYPNQLNIGKLAPETEYNLLLRIIVPVVCEITSEISGLELVPRQLTPGRNEIQLHLEKLSQSIYIEGSIFIVSSSLKRRITLTAYIQLADEQFSPTQNQIIWEPENWAIIPKLKFENPESEMTSVQSEELTSSRQSENNYEEQQQQSPLESRIRRGVKPNDKIFSSLLKNTTVEEQPQKDVETKKQLGDAFIISGQESKIEHAPNQEHLSDPSSSLFTRSYRPNSIFYNLEPMPSEPSNKQEDGSKEKRSPSINPIFEQTSPPSQT